MENNTHFFLEVTLRAESNSELSVSMENRDCKVMSTESYKKTRFVVKVVPHREVKSEK